MSIMADARQTHSLALELSKAVPSHWFDQRPSDPVPPPLLLRKPSREQARFLQTHKAPFNVHLRVQLIVYVHTPACKSLPV